MRGPIIIVVAALLTGSFPVVAARSAPEEFAVYEYGQVSCGVWIESRANRNKPNDYRFKQAVEWIGGFMTAYNLYVQPGVRTDITGSTDQEGMYAWLDKYCGENPTKEFVSAIYNLILHLKSLSPSPPKK